MENLGNQGANRLFNLLLLGWLAYLSLALFLIVGAALFTLFLMLLQGQAIPGEFIALFFVCLMILVLASAFAFSRTRYFRKLIAIIARKKVAANEKAAAQEPQNASPRPVNGIETIKDAEEDLDIWTLIVQLKGQDAGDRISAIRKLRSHNTPAIAGELAKAMLEDPDLNVRFEAFLALKFQGKDNVGLLLERLKAEGDTNAKLGLLELLRRTSDERQAGTLAYLYGFETEKAVKLGILDSLGKFPGAVARDLAISVVRKEDDKDVRLKALGVLYSYDDGVTEDVLKRLKGDPDDDIKNGAVKALKAIEIRNEN